MKIPVKYNFRSLLVRRVSTAMTVLGIGLTVGIVVVLLAMIQGLDRTFTETGDPLNLIVLRKSSGSEVNSYFLRGIFETIRFLPGVARDEKNEPLAVGELVVVISLRRADGSEGNVVIRGTSERGFRLRPEVQIVEGRVFRSGVRELILSRSLLRRFPGLALGGTIDINNQPWRIVGIFDAGTTAYASEMWTGYQDVAEVWERPIYSSILLRAESPEAVAELKKRISDDRRLQLDAFSQPEYFADQTVTSVGLKVLATLVALIMGIGSCFAVMNMMYGQVMSRSQEVATLRAIGFRRRHILSSFVMESLLLGLAGGLVGCALGSLFHGYSAGTSNLVSFSEVVFNFRVTPEILIQGLAYALVVGLLGGFLPARRAATVKLIDVLRE
ncbi:MAG: ABC transporter permease [Acidobacteriota bacterium]